MLFRSAAVVELGSVVTVPSHEEYVGENVEGEALGEFRDAATAFDARRRAGEDERRLGRVRGAARPSLHLVHVSVSLLIAV